MALPATGRDPLSPRWLDCRLEPPRAGVLGQAHLTVENAGSATWRSDGEGGLQLSYHWLDPLGNAIVWDGIRSPLPEPVSPGSIVELVVPVLAPRPPGRYRLAVDLVEEHRFWLQELGCAPLEVDVEVAPRIARRLAVVVHGGPDALTAAALAAQEEPIVDSDAHAVAHLVAGAEPAPDWSRLLLDAHTEGFATVGPALVPVGGMLDRRRAARRLAPWAPGTGRNPRFGLPLLLPSLEAGIEPAAHLGLPAYEGGDGVFDGRIVVRLPTRSGRRRG